MQFQTSRARDGVYQYLEAVFVIVEHYKVRRKTSRLLRHAFKLAGLPFDEDADPFAAVIRCTCEHSLDNKTISKWSRALRYIAHSEVPGTSLKTFMKKAGGINACAARFARYYGRRNGFRSRRESLSSESLVSFCPRERRQRAIDVLVGSQRRSELKNVCLRRNRRIDTQVGLLLLPGCEGFGESAVSCRTFFYGQDRSAAIDVDDRDVEPLIFLEQLNIALCVRV